MRATDIVTGSDITTPRRSMDRFRIDSANRGAIVGFRLVHSAGMEAVRGRSSNSDTVVHVAASFRWVKKYKGEVCGFRLVREDT